MPEVLSSSDYRKQVYQTANGLTTSIIKEITYRGGFATRINTQGQYDPAKRIFRPGSTVKGMTDIVGVLNGKALFIEVKIGRDKLRPAQEEVKAKILAAAGCYFCARDFHSFNLWMNGL